MMGITQKKYIVTLSVRVWIEIYHCYGMHDEGYVTLSVRVWIEMALRT